MNIDKLKLIRENSQDFYWGDSQPDSTTMGSIMGSYLIFGYDLKQDNMYVYTTAFDNINEFKSRSLFNPLLEGYQIIKDIIAFAKVKSSEDDYDTAKIAYTEKFINENFVS